MKMTGGASRKASQSTRWTSARDQRLRLVSVAPLFPPSLSLPRKGGGDTTARLFTSCSLPPCGGGSGRRGASLLLGRRVVGGHALGPLPPAARRATACPRHPPPP